MNTEDTSHNSTSSSQNLNHGSHLRLTEGNDSYTGYMSKKADTKSSTFVKGLKSIRHRLKVAANRSLNLTTILDDAASSNPDKTLLYVDKPLQYGRLFGRALNARALCDFVNRTANILVEAGVKRYDRVAIYKTNEPDYALLSLAIIKAGGVAAPIHSNMAPDILSAYVQYVGAKFMITDAATYAARVKDRASLPMIERFIFPDAPQDAPEGSFSLNDRLDGAPTGIEAPKLYDDTDILITHTSGTTGVPKGVLAMHGPVMRGARDVCYALHEIDGSRLATAFHCNHKISHDMHYGLFLSQQPIYVYSQTRGEALLEQLSINKNTGFCAFPDIFLEMLDHGLSGYDLSSVGAWLSSGDASHEAHMKHFTDAGGKFRYLGVPISSCVYIELYGASEMGTGARMRIFKSNTPFTGERPVGRQIPKGPKITIVDETFTPLKDGEIGRIAVSGPSLFRGYWSASDRLHGTFEDNKWWTGDIGYKDKKGQVYQLDREADVIETPNGSAFSLPIEEKLLCCQNVLEAVVLRNTVENKNAGIMALVQLRKGTKRDNESIRAEVNRMLKAHEQIDQIIIVTGDEIERGLTGKVLKRKMREKYLSQQQAQPISQQSA